MSPSQERKEWRKFNRLQGQYFRRWFIRWNRYYNEQLNILLDNMNMIDPSSAIFNQSDTTELFNKMYGDTGVAFARHGFATTKAASPEQIDNWLFEMIRYASLFGGESIESINRTGRDFAKKLIAEATATAIEEGLSGFELEQEVEKIVKKDWRIHGKFNAERIARTEISTASNHGAFIGARDTGLKLRKIWLTNMDGRERDSHAMANGQSVPMNEPFIVGSSRMMHAGAKGAPAAENINCRCVTIYRSSLFD